MEIMQAIIKLNNGIRKYGTIICYDGVSEKVKFIPNTSCSNKTDSSLVNIIELIPLSLIYSIDTCLK